MDWSTMASFPDVFQIWIKTLEIYSLGILMIYFLKKTTKCGSLRLPSDVVWWMLKVEHY